jgi:hypothetical protein
MKEETGFKHGLPENPAKTWEKQINDQTFTFKKPCREKGCFCMAVRLEVPMAPPRPHQQRASTVSET